MPDDRGQAAAPSPHFHMRSRSTDSRHLATRLEKLELRLTEARGQAARVAATRAATKRKLDSIGKNLAELKSQLATLATERAKSKK